MPRQRDMQEPEARQQFEVVREIAASADTVFRILTSEAGMKAWAAPCRSARWVHPPGVTTPGVGSVRHLHFPGGLAAIESIVAWEPGRQLNYAFIEPGLFALPFTALTRDYEGVTRVDPIGHRSCRLRWAAHFEAPGALALPAAALRHALQPVIKLVVGRIARLAEAESA